MNLRLCRYKSGVSCTIGELYIDGVYECFTLEDVVRAEKIPGKTAIPAGEYDVIVSYSNRFKCPLPLLQKVPNFTGVRIHAGNTDADTEGCILVGLTRGEESVGASRAALKPLVARISEALSLGERVTISVENADE